MSPDDAFFTRMRDYLTDECDWFGMHEDNTVENLAEAFEAARKWPKPPEPTGLGAVVEDATNDVWVRTLAADKFGKPWRSESRGRSAGWRDITAVEVLSEGVTS